MCMCLAVEIWLVHNVIYIMYFPIIVGYDNWNPVLFRTTVSVTVIVIQLAITLIHVGDASLTSNAERPCPDDIVVFTCNVSGVDLFWQVFTSDNIFVAQFFIDVNSEVNSSRPRDSMLGFTTTLQSRTPSGDSTSTLTTTASAQIDGYTVVCSDVTGMMVVRKTINLAGEFKLSL